MASNQYVKPLFFAAGFAALGVTLLMLSNAATNGIAIEAESATPGPGVTEVTDPDASGGKALAFSAVATPAPSVTPTPPPSANCTTNVTASSFASAVSAALAGDVLCLANGNYGNWNGTNKAITIRPQAGASPTISLTLRSGDCCFTIDGGRTTLEATEAGLIINDDGGPSIGAGVTNVTIKNTRFTTGIKIDGPTNSNILFDHNLHANISIGWTAAIHLSYGASQHSGVTIQNSLFRDMAADGIQTGLGVNIINNEFARIEPADPSQHTDAIQSVGGGGIVIRGNYIHEGEQAIGMFDGTGGNIIEHNVIKNFTAHWISLGGDRPASVIQFNTIVGTGARLISCPSKSGYQPSLTIIRNNIAGSIETTGTVNCSPTENRNNLLSSGGGGQNLSGTPQFQGGTNPTTFLGYLLAAGSPGKNAATDGSDVGVHAQ